MVRVTKEQGVSIGLGALASILTAIGTVWSVGIPLAEAQIKNEIRTQTEPLTDAFYVLLVQSIESQQDAIIAMEFKREMCGTNTVTCWTLRDATELSRAHERLIASQQAKARLEKK